MTTFVNCFPDIRHHRIRKYFNRFFFRWQQTVVQLLDNFSFLPFTILFFIDGKGIVFLKVSECTPLPLRDFVIFIRNGIQNLILKMQILLWKLTCFSILTSASASEFPAVGCSMD